jgi:hypothetical protein
MSGLPEHFALHHAWACTVPSLLLGPKTGGSEGSSWIVPPQLRMNRAEIEASKHERIHG